MVDYYPDKSQMGLNYFETGAVTAYLFNGPGVRERGLKLDFLNARGTYMGLGRRHGVERTRFEHEAHGDRLVLPATHLWAEFIEAAFVHWREKYPVSDMQTIGDAHQDSPLYKQAELDARLATQAIADIQRIADVLAETPDS